MTAETTTPATPSKIEGFATREGTRRYHARHVDRVVADHVRTVGQRGGELALSSIGIGTYIGTLDDERDAAYAAAIGRALELGIAVIDTAINYRAQRSERVIGALLASLIGGGAIGRDEIFVASKAGFLPFDRDRPVDPGGYLSATYLESGIVDPAELVGGMHCIAPRYMADQLARSRDNLGLATIDCYYVHNPETQLDEIDRVTFYTRMRAAFEALETAAADGHIRSYGIATWHGLREPAASRHHLDLFALVDVAREVAGDAHHFAFVQLPINPRMPEATSLPTQRGSTVLDAARALGLYVMASASIGQGKLADTLGLTRSLPGLGTALVGMSSVAHVEHNVATFRR